MWSIFVSLCLVLDLKWYNRDMIRKVRWYSISKFIIFKDLYLCKRFDCVKKEKNVEKSQGNFSKITENAHWASTTEAAYSEHLIAIHSISMAGYVTTILAFVWGESAKEVSNFCDLRRKKKASCNFTTFFSFLNLANLGCFRCSVALKKSLSFFWRSVHILFRT